MTTQTTYQGYINYETWNVCLWIDNEYAVYLESVELANKGKVKSEEAEQFVKMFWPEGTPDMDQEKEYDAVDWDEVAECINENKTEEYEEEEE